jgi:hypothetical protein
MNILTGDEFAGLYRQAVVKVVRPTGWDKETGPASIQMVFVGTESGTVRRKKAGSMFRQNGGILLQVRTLPQPIRALSEQSLPQKMKHSFCSEHRCRHVTIMDFHFSSPSLPRPTGGGGGQQQQLPLVSVRYSPKANLMCPNNTNSSRPVPL